MGSGSTNGANSCATCRCAAWCEKYRRARIGHTLSAAARAYADSRTQPRPFQPPIERGLRDEASSAATLAPADQTSRPRPCQRRCADAGTCGSVKLNAGSGAGPLSIRVRPSSVTVTAVQRAQGTVPGKRTPSLDPGALRTLRSDDQRLPGPLLRLRPVRAAVDPALPRRVLGAAQTAGPAARDLIIAPTASATSMAATAWAMTSCGASLASIRAPITPWPR